MKALKFAIAALFFSAIFTACKKENANPTPSSTGIEGKWAGKYGYGSDEPTIYYSFNIKADGTIQELHSDGTVSGEGTWTKTGNTFVATHHFLPPLTSSFISTATYDAVAQKLTGTWKYSSAAGNAGKWYMQKK